jgi:hypothetical protein
MSEPPTPDPDDRGDIARQAARILAHLPADHPLVDPEWRITPTIVVYNDNGVDGVAIAMPDLGLLHMLTTTTGGAEVVIVTQDGDDGVRRPICAYRDGLFHRDADARDAVDDRFDALVGHLPAPLAAEVRQAIADEDVAFTDHLAASTAGGRLAFLTPARHRGYVLDRNRDGEYAQVTTIDPEDGTIASSALFRDGVAVAGLMSGRTDAA